MADHPSQLQHIQALAESGDRLAAGIMEMHAVTSSLIARFPEKGVQTLSGDNEAIYLLFLSWEKANEALSFFR